MRRIKSIVWGSRKRRVVSLLALIVLVASTAAVAAWLTTSNGTSGAKFGALQAVTVTAEFDAGAEIYPSVDYWDLYADITHSNPGPVYIASVVGNGAPDTSSAICDASLAGFSLFANPAVIYDGAAPLGPGTAEDVALTAVSFGNDIASECQGLEVTVPLTVSFSTAPTE